MDARMEKVELIREKTGVSYDDAKAALEANNEDVLDAIIWLERLGKVSATTATYTSTSTASGAPISPEMAEAQSAYEESSRKTTMGESFSRLAAAIKRLTKKLMESSFIVDRKGTRILSVPALFLVLLLLFSEGGLIPVLVFGLFIDCRYSFEGMGTLGSGINQVIDAIADGVASVKDAIFGEKRNKGDQE